MNELSNESPTLELPVHVPVYTEVLASTFLSALSSRSTGS